MRRLALPPHAADLVGAGVATLCGAHCLLTPVLLLVLPVLAGSWLLDERVESVLLAGAAVVGVAAIVPVSLRAPGRRLPLLLLAAGLGALLLGRIALEEGTAANVVAVVVGAALVAAAHLRNRRLLLSMGEGAGARR